MERNLKKILKTLKVNEGLVSTLMGGMVVLVMTTMIFNYFKTLNKGGQIDEKSATEETKEIVISKDLPTTYKVVKGDDLWHISERFYNSGYNYVDIAKENKLRDVNAIEVGQELTIPKVEAKKATTVKSTKTETKTGNISIETDKYTTVKGDYLWSIALRAYGDGYKWTEVYKANKDKIGSNPSVLLANIELSLPR